jgi:N-ethylmaleimide reductase
MSDYKNDALLRSVSVGALEAENRVWMAPLTRSRSTMPGNVPNAMMAEYYQQRAGAGVIIAEATPVTPWGHGYYATPGIHSDEQVEGWKAVTDGVHAKGGKIVLQLWHVGRVSHSAFMPGGGQPVSSTDVISESKTYLDHTMERHANTAPRKLATDEIEGVVDEFRDGAQRAKDAGFDGVEIHGANSYLLDQFVRDGVNKRDDIYGGSIENRIRFPLMVADAVGDVWRDDDGGASRVGYRISPLSEHKDVRDSDPQAVFCELAKGLGERRLGFLHAVETWDRSTIDERVATVLPAIVKAFKDAGGGLYVGNGDYTPAQADEAIGSGWADAIAFGKLWISNPDLAKRIGVDGPYRKPEPETFYGGGAEGYTSFGTLEDEVSAGVTS